jgi:hypothetical protein
MNHYRHTLESLGKDDKKALYDLLGNKDERKKFDTQGIEV